jgi:hypothetical protein
MTYIEWISELGPNRFNVGPLLAWTAGHTAGREAERERIRDIINSVEDVNCRDDDWYIACDLIMERIDATE